MVRVFNSEICGAFCWFIDGNECFDFVTQKLTELTSPPNSPCHLIGIAMATITSSAATNW
jgi:hypothetical protein